MIKVTSSAKAPSPMLELAKVRWQSTHDSRDDQRADRQSSLAELPYRKQLSASGLAAVRDAVDGALRTVKPYVIVNRSAEDALAILDGTAGPRVGGIATPASFEIAAGIRAANDTSEHVMYGSLQFADLQRTRANRHLLNVGQSEYGDVALVLKDASLDRATLTPWDSWSLATAIKGEQLRPARSAMVETVTDSLLRRREVAQGVPLESVQSLVSAPDSRLIRKMLTSAQLTNPSENEMLATTRFLPGTPEVQIYGSVTSADIREIRLSANILPDEDRTIRAAARARGIPVRMDRQRTPDGSAIQRRDALAQAAAAKARHDADPLVREIHDLLS